MKIDILFLDGLVPKYMNLSFLGYLFAIAAELETNNYNFKILNINTLPDYSLKGLVTELKNYEFGAIGMTTNADNIRYIYKICDELKRTFPNTPIILGGPQVTYTDNKTINECKCDIIIRNDGEYTIINVLDYFKGKINSLHNIKGITFREDNSIFINPDSDPININNLPTPQYGILNNKKYWIIPKNITNNDFDKFLEKTKSGNAFILTGRGCPNQCAFCVEGNIKRKYTYRNAENFKKDLEYFFSITGAKVVNIADDTFTSSPNRVKEICKVIKEIQKKHPFVWFAEGRVDMLSKHPELIGLMKDAGLYKLQIGIESGNQEVLNIYKKGITLEQIEKVLVEASKYEDLDLHGNIIIGNPKESYQEFLKSLDFIERLYIISNFKIDISFSVLTPFVGTPIRLDPDSYDIELLYNDFEFKRLAISDLTCKPKDFTVNDLNNLAIFTPYRLQQFLNKNMFSLSRKEIIKRLHYYSKEKHSLSWNKTFKSLYALKKYEKITQKATTLFSENISAFSELVPLRLWDIEYNKEQNGYLFISLSGNKNILIDFELYLWEQASGKNTISEIHENLNKREHTMEHIYDYYKYLEDNLAIVFQDF